MGLNELAKQKGYGGVMPQTNQYTNRIEYVLYYGEHSTGIYKVLVRNGYDMEKYLNTLKDKD